MNNNVESELGIGDGYMSIDDELFNNFFDRYVPEASNNSFQPKVMDESKPEKILSIELTNAVKK